VTLQDEFNQYLATNNTEAVASLAALAAKFSRADILQVSYDNWLTLTATPLAFDAEEATRLSTLAQTMCELQADMPRLLNGMDAILDDNRTPAALRPFITAQIPHSVSISRCDFLRAPDGWHLIEINTGPGCDGITVHEYNDCIAEDPFLVKFFDANSCIGPAPLDLLIDTVRERCAALPIDANPTVAISDWYKSEPCEIENSNVAEKYLRHGFSTILCHQREFRYEHGRLWCSGRPVDVVHRLFLLDEMREDPASAIPILEAAVDGSIVLVSSFFDEWAGHKHSFALFHQAADAGLLPERTAELVAQSVPRTWRLTEGGAGNPSEEAGPVDRLVIKPVMGHSAEGVVLGATGSRDRFERALAAARASGVAHVMQRFVASQPVQIPWFEHEAITFADGQMHPGVFVIEGQPAGMWTRVLRGTSPKVINIGSGSHRGGVWHGQQDPGGGHQEPSGVWYGQQDPM
jgi:hypothetical protein